MILRAVLLFTTILGLLLPAQALARWPALTAVSKSSGPTPYGRAWKQCAVLAVSNAMTERGEWSGNVEVDGGELVEMEGVTFHLLSKEAGKHIYTLRPHDPAVGPGEELSALNFCVAYQTSWAVKFGIEITAKSNDVVVQVSEAEGKTYHSLLKRQTSANDMFVKNMDTGICRCLPKTLMPNDLQPQSPLLGCSDIPTTDAPAFVPAKTGVADGKVSVVAASSAVNKRVVSLRLGSGGAECNAAMTVQLSDCKYEYVISSDFEALRSCNWTVAPPETGYDVRTNTAYLEWIDVLPSGQQSRNLVSMPITIKLPVEIKLSTSVALPEESGVKNFTVEEVGVEGAVGARTLVIRWSMESRWPNNLTLATLTPPFSGSVQVAAYVPPVCVKTYNGSLSGASSGDQFAGQLVHNADGFTVNDWCKQTGTFKVSLGSRCDVGGTYRVAFDTSCFENAVQNDCTGRVEATPILGAQASGAPSLNVCSS